MALEEEDLSDDDITARMRGAFNSNALLVARMINPNSFKFTMGAENQVTPPVSPDEWETFLDVRNSQEENAGFRTAPWTVLTGAFPQQLYGGTVFATSNWGVIFSLDPESSFWRYVIPNTLLDQDKTTSQRQTFSVPYGFPDLDPNRYTDLLRDIRSVILEPALKHKIRFPSEWPMHNGEVAFPTHARFFHDNNQMFASSAGN